jgi:hypothetical protein
MAIIVKNQTGNLLDIYIREGKTVQISASGQLDLLSECTMDEISNADDIVFHIINGNILINNGVEDLTQIRAIDLVRDYKQVLPVDETGIKTNIITRKTPDDRIFIYQSPRPWGTTTYFTSEGDDTSSYLNIGGGQSFFFKHVAGEINDTIYIDFNVITNSTYIHEGYINYVDCNFDKVCMAIMPAVTSYMETSGTFYTLTEYGIVVPAAGDGNIQLTEIPKLVAAGYNDTGTTNPGYWDADFNISTGTFDNIQPNIYGTGEYNIWGTEIPLSRFLNKLILIGSGQIHLETQEQGQIFHGMRIRVSISPNLDPDHDFQISAILCTYRDKVGFNAL